MKVKTPCPKCLGSGKITAFSHIDSGDCFMCSGSGEISVSSIANAPNISDTARKQALWIATAKPAQWARLDWQQINKARSFAHSEVGHKLVAWPDAGEDRFQQLQDIKRAEQCSAS